MQFARHKLSRMKEYKKIRGYKLFSQKITLPYSSKFSRDLIFAKAQKIIFKGFYFREYGKIFQIDKKGGVNKKGV